VKFADIMRPIADALKALKSYVHPKAGLLESGLADHAIRLDVADRAIRMLGDVPNVGESIPALHGLNLFVSVDNDQRPPA
jgi:hypothetical protein